MKAKRIIGIVLILISTLVVATTENKTEAVPAAIILTLIGLVLLFKKSKAQRAANWVEKNKQKNQQALQRGVSVQVNHVSGLAVAENVLCDIECDETMVSISASGAVFKIPMERVTIFEIFTNVEIQKHYVSSVGGAVGGAVLFGPLGAMVGGRAKQKETKTTTSYLIINYKKENEVLSVSFEIPVHQVSKAIKMKHAANTKRSNEVMEIEL